MPKKPPPFSYASLRIMTVLFGALAVYMGREAISQGYLWNSGYNARIGDQTAASTLSWIIIGALVIVKQPQVCCTLKDSQTKTDHQLKVFHKSPSGTPHAALGKEAGKKPDTIRRQSYAFGS